MTDPLDSLRCLAPSDTLYGVRRRTRFLSLYLMWDGKPVDVTMAVAKALNRKVSTQYGTPAFVIGSKGSGIGLVESLGRALWPTGYGGLTMDGHRPPSRDVAEGILYRAMFFKDDIRWHPDSSTALHYQEL